MIIKHRIPIVIPYLAKDAQGRELEYAVAGWMRHFDCPSHIYVVGDRDEHVDRVLKMKQSGESYASFIDCPQVDDTPGQCRKHIDHVMKFVRFMDTHPYDTEFIYACDDMYAVNDFGLGSVLQEKIVSEDMVPAKDAGKKWNDDLMKTRTICLKNGLPTWNWVCHLPILYNVNKLRRIYELFDCYHKSYVVENIYFNVYCQRRVPLRISRSDNFKYGVYDRNPDPKEIEEAFRRKIWITNSPDGWVPELYKRLEKYYHRYLIPE